MGSIRRSLGRSRGLGDCPCVGLLSPFAMYNKSEYMSNRVIERLSNWVIRSCIFLNNSNSFRLVVLSLCSIVLFLSGSLLIDIYHTTNSIDQLKWTFYFVIGIVALLTGLCCMVWGILKAVYSEIGQQVRNALHHVSVSTIPGSGPSMIPSPSRQTVE